MNCFNYTALYILVINYYLPHGILLAKVIVDTIVNTIKHRIKHFIFGVRMNGLMISLIKR